MEDYQRICQTQTIQGSLESLRREHWRQMASLPPTSSPAGKSSFGYWGGLLNVQRHGQMWNQTPGCESTDSKGHLYAGSWDWPSPFRSEFNEMSKKSNQQISNLSRSTCTARRRLKCPSPPWTGFHPARYRSIESPTNPYRSMNI